MQAQDTGVSAHGVAPHREVIAEGDDIIGSEHAPAAEPAGEAAAAQDIGGSSDTANGIGSLPNAGDEHAASIQAAAAVASSSPETAAAIVSTSDTIPAHRHALSPSTSMPMPEQSSWLWHDAAQQGRTHTEATEIPAAAQSTGIKQHQSADTAANTPAPPFFASSDTAHASTQAQAAALALLKPSPQGSAAARQHQGPDATVGADATTESAAEIGQDTSGVPGLSAAEVRQLMRLMQSMQAAATWPNGAHVDQMTTEQKGAHADHMTNEQKGAHADQMTNQQRLPAEAAPVDQATGEQRLPAKAAPAEASEVTAVAYQMPAYADNRQLQVG